MRFIAISLAAYVLCFFCPESLFAADFSGPVVSVLDGDTIEVLHNTYPERVRLSGIDCPEKGQAFGNRAKQAASALVFGLAKQPLRLFYGSYLFEKQASSETLGRWHPLCFLVTSPCS